VSQHPGISLADVYAASGYHDHLEEIRQQNREDEAYARELQAQTPSLVQQKLKQNARNDPLHLDENVSSAIADGLRNRSDLPQP